MRSAGLGAGCPTDRRESDGAVVSSSSATEKGQTSGCGPRRRRPVAASSAHGSCRSRSILYAVSGAPRGRRKGSFGRRGVGLTACYRSGYPDEVVVDVVTASQLRPGSRVLEIGCGTGQLSVPLAQYGAELVAVELGQNLAAIPHDGTLLTFRPRELMSAGSRSGRCQSTRSTSSWAASSLHWIDPGVRFSTPARALKPGGILVVVHAHHVKGGPPGFFGDTQPALRAVGSERRPLLRAASTRRRPHHVSRTGGRARLREGRSGTASRSRNATRPVPTWDGSRPTLSS